ncbi:NADH oxidase [Acaromyces ingoldii]|uniref:NADH oxidase n=1 Tax=Acaromyces ingoldii TaxID=215250 RepID=A0A316YM43_9BASI|nr:NADH oxidase [Acaromyces ingoldii]PWN89728.1 NADH oxidase [Acaromyces ingoldii]
MDLAFTPLTLPCGQVLKNRIAKAAMEENLATASQNLVPSQELIRVYQAWADGGSGLIISGNVMVDYRAVGGAAPVSTSRELVSEVRKDKAALAAYRDWASAATSNGTQFWLQLNHPGRQAFGPAKPRTIAPSPVAVDVGRMGKAFFNVPQEMTEDDIEDVIARFAYSARFAEEIGATGVQIHGAHGYLISQFLSPLTNQRKDRWGGSLENRARFLFEIVKAIRAAVSPSFAVALKINSADFQRGGFSQDDAEWVITQLNGIRADNGAGLDLVEISGGNYESPAMSGSPKERSGSSSTQKREAYFLDFAQRIAGVAQMPIMVTGGISRRDIVQKVVAPAPGQTADSVRTVAGMGTALGLMPDLPNRLARGEDPCPSLTAGTSWILPSTLVSLAKLRQISHCIYLIGQGKRPSPGVSQVWALIADWLRGRKQLQAYRALVVRISSSAASP